MIIPNNTLTSTANHATTNLGNVACGTGLIGKIVVYIYYGIAAVTTNVKYPTSVTCGGNAMTKLAQDIAGTNQSYAQIWYYLDPADGNNAIVVTWAGTGTNDTYNHWITAFANCQNISEAQAFPSNVCDAYGSPTGNIFSVVTPTTTFSGLQFGMAGNLTTSGITLGASQTTLGELNTKYEASYKDTDGTSCTQTYTATTTTSGVTIGVAIAPIKSGRQVRWFI